jgi:anaerobic magnesium-protoporphyrin IX monomethyl ester cyclase
MQILLLHPNCDSDVVGTVVPWAVTWLACIAGALRAAGYAHVRYIDASVGGLSEDDLERVIQRERPDVVAVASICPSTPCAEKLLRLAKDVHPPAVTLLGGIQDHGEYERLLLGSPWIDALVLGDSVEFFRGIVSAVENGNWDLARPELPGIAYAESGRVRVSPPGPSFH